VSETETLDPAAGFAALMSKAAEQAGPAEEAPFGYTRDEATGELRPKKAQGRPRKSPTLDELKAQKEAAAAETAAAAKPEDRAPSARRPHRRTRGEPEADKPKPPVVQFREGVIAKGVNRLYRKAGKMVRVMDRDVGQALIDITRKDTLDDGTPDPEDVTVGEAWEEIARTNPRIRAFLMKIIAGGAWGQLFACHAPVLLAVLMKDAIRKRIPFAKLFEAFLDGGEDGEAPADGTVAEGLTMPDMGQMMAMAQQFAEQAMGGRGPEDAAYQQRMAEQTMNGRAAPSSPRAPEAPVVPDPRRSPAGPGVTAAVPAASGS
jgi:hypothetical protein